ncbi:bifunctional tetrahydrofolate synthase/dihydrofolate synthase [Pseudomonas floridensis]|uniref:Dihydrofolate synthase/folylpolyglutamate synthase n=1 Tax=Pseudomonas floridensis TaxID=1958950 RepID=A0A1X0N7Z2_9PSED|nr:bifunctional tetrahydrofolate synthase/dihydrofolate synthase [Pseudomonas floridensis]ORC59929.1 bifunctional tetrahydrofolate synthase/dihydrofolate synthase [Pseudomonas floridensis]
MMKSSCTASSSLEQWLSYIDSLHAHVIDMSLKRIEAVADRLDIRKPGKFTFLAGGTNGKGTTCHAIEKTLIYAGYKVGVFSSPHILDYKETVRIQGNKANESSFATAFHAINEARKEITLTPFEFNTLAALHIMKQANVDVAVIEVGMGGRDDATNIVEADLSVITNVAIDHEAWLGKDRESIGLIKAGIFRTHRHAIIGELSPPESLTGWARQIDAIPLQRGIDWDWQLADQSWSFKDKQGTITGLPRPLMPIPNMATALAALRASGLNFDLDDVRKMLSTDNLPGRFQIFLGKPTVILDAAHNPHAATYLAERLNDFHPKGKVLIVIGVLIDKDIHGILAPLKPVASKWFCCGTAAGPRSSSPEDISRHLDDASNYPDITAGWEAARREARDEDVIVICGSFMSVAPLLNRVGQS